MSQLHYQAFFNSIPLELAPLFEDIEFVWEALKALDSFFTGSSIESKIDSRCVLLNKDQITIGKNVIVEPGALIEGPCFIGDGCLIRHGAAVREGTVLGPGCLVGHSSEVKRSILLDGAKAPHFNYIGDSILGSKVNLGAGVKFANLRLDRKEVCVRFGEEVFSTGMRKFGGVLGDGCQIGCNCVINPGSLLAPRSAIQACSSVGGGVGVG